MSNEYDKIIQQMIEGIQYLIKQNNTSTKIYDGLVVAVNLDGTYKVKVNDKEYNFKKYGQNAVEINQVVKVFIPQNNINIAFIM
ncbi:MAG: hypothetical protein RSD67_05325 [Oscillospiraceae bacterium]